MSSEAFVTLATNDGYALGALVLAQSIRQVGTKRNLVILISNDLSDLIRKSLERSFDELIVVDQLNSNDIEHLDLLSRPELGITFTKINCWLLDQYSKCVFLDADCVVLRPIDDLFEREEFSAAADAGWPDCFNSGVFVYRPSKQTFNKLMLFASQQNASFDGGDQGLFNSFFSNWRTEDISRHLPFTYNVTANAFYSYLPAVTRFRNDIHIVHFAGALKPWQLTFNPQNEQLSGNLGGQSDIQRDFLLTWWRILHQHVWPTIQQLNEQSNFNSNNIDGQSQLGGSVIGSLNYGNLIDNKGIEVGSAAHRRAWEAGHIDYFGRDSFQNIEQQLQRNIEQRSYQYHPAQQKQISPDKTTTTTTSILKTPLNEVKPRIETTTLPPQNISKVPPTSVSKSSLNGTTTTPSTQQTTTLTTAIVETSLTEVTPISQQTTLRSEVPSKEPTSTRVISQNVTELSTTTTTTSTASGSKSSFNETTVRSGNLSKASTATPIISQNITKLPTTATNLLKSSSNEVTSLPPKQQTAVRSEGPIKEPTSTRIVSQNITQLPTTTTIKTTRNLSEESSPLPTRPGNPLQNTLKDSTAASQNPLKISSKESTETLEDLPRKVFPTVLKESAPLSANLFQSSSKDSTTTTHSQRENPPQTPVGSIRANENQTPPPPAEHQSNWTVKSTIVTSYTQGAGELAGPTVVSKVISEASATSSSDIPTKTSIKQVSDSSKSSIFNETAKTSSEHFAWLFDKIFVAITYTIGLCYLLFLVAIRRSKNADVIHGNGTAVRGVPPSTNSGNRVNK